MEPNSGNTPGERVRHVCLAGQNLTNNWVLIQKLKAHHQVTLVERVRLVSRNSVLTTADVLIVDCGRSQGLGLRLVPLAKKYHPRLQVILVDGGLSQMEIAAAFRQGARDYFAEPYEPDLLVERVAFLLRNQPTADDSE